MNLPLATVYDMATAADTTTLACHHGQMVVITIDHPTVHKTALEMFPLGSTIPLATVARLAGALGLVRIIDADELDALYQKLAIAHADLAQLVGALAETNWSRNELVSELDIYVDEIEHQGWLLDVTLAELGAVQTRLEQQATSLHYADKDRAQQAAKIEQQTAQIEALRRAIDAAEQASKGAKPSIHPGEAALLPFEPEPEPKTTTILCPHCQEQRPRQGFNKHEPACARKHAAAVVIEGPAEPVVVLAVRDEPTQRWPERSSRLLVDDGQPISDSVPVGPLSTELQRQRANAQHGVK